MRCALHFDNTAMQRRNAPFLVALVLMLSEASATQPCSDPVGCIDEASATVVAVFDAYAQRCAEANPVRAQSYASALEYYLHGESSAFLERLRQSGLYTQVRAEIENGITRSKEPLLLTCEKFAARTF